MFTKRIGLLTFLLWLFMAQASYGQSTPEIYGLGPGGENWDAIWIAGAGFEADSRVYIFTSDWSTYQILWGPAWTSNPGIGVAEDGSLITLQVTDPTVRYSFGYDGVYVLVVNGEWTTSEWAWTQSPPPVTTNGDAGCDDQYCIWMTGYFPLNAFVDFRPHGQPDVIPASNDGLVMNVNWLTLALTSGVHHIYDTVGLDGWVVNGLFPNWSGGLYLPPKDRSIIGHVDGISLSGAQYYINGWACAKTYAASISVHVYLGGAAGTGTYGFNGMADQASETGVNNSCSTTGTHYRFSLPIPYSITQNYGGQPIYVHGISPAGLDNSLIGNSGAFSVPAVDLSVTGWISGVVVDNQQYYLRGWACEKTNPGSIDVHFYAGGPAGSGTIVTGVTANLTSDATIAHNCNASGANYRFSIQLSTAIRQQYGGQTIFVHGISPLGLGNLLLGNSGNLTIPPLGPMSSREYISLGDRVLAVDTSNLP